MLKMPVARAVALCLLVASTHLWASTAGARLHGSKAFHQRQLQGAADGQTLDYWKRLVGTPSRLGGLTKKAGVLPVRKYSMEQFDIIPFQVRTHDLAFVCRQARPGGKVPVGQSSVGTVLAQRVHILSTTDRTLAAAHHKARSTCVHRRPCTLRVPSLSCLVGKGRSHAVQRLPWALPASRRAYMHVQKTGRYPWAWSR